MPLLEAFIAITPEIFDAGAAAVAADTTAGAITAAEIGAGITDAALLGGEYLGGLGAGIGGAGVGAGITQAELAANALAGGAGAGAEGVNALQVAAQQAQAAGIPNSGFTQLSPDQIAQMRNQMIANTMPGEGVQLASNTAGGPEFLPKSTGIDFGPPVAPATPLSTQQVADMIAKEQASAGIGGGLGEMWTNMSPLQKGMAAYAGTTGLARLGAFGYGSTPQFEPYSGSLSKYSMSPNFQPMIATPRVYKPRYAGGGPVEQMSDANAVGANTGYPMANIARGAYATPYQQPIAQNVVTGDQDTRVDQYTGEERLASGGIAGYAGGGSLSTAMDFYKMMAGQQADVPEGKTAPKSGGDVGIYYDTDPDTQRADALTAAQIRMAKLNKRTGMQGMGTVRPTPLGQLNMVPPMTKAPADQQFQEAAQGGIMQASYAAGGSTLGGYAAGGNPRLLKGPGDGMSDNIPATIGGRQPARLADGEFVVPADVVSHLGNGSTDAGAKKLHSMMDNVRKARTGRKAQGKQINPDKYMPK